MSINPHALYPTKTAAGSSGYPYGSARDVVISGDGTGTPWKSDFVNDLWGFLQSLLDMAGIVPNGLPDSLENAQYANAIRYLGGAPGELVPTFEHNAPIEGISRTLLLDGSGISVAAYQALVDVCWVGSLDNADAAARPGGCFYRADDAGGTIPNSSGVYFILPDARGQFPRGTDPTGIYDINGTARFKGDFQDYVVFKHTHDLEADIVGDREIKRGYHAANTEAPTNPIGALDAGYVTGDDVYASDMFDGNHVDPIPTDKLSLWETRPKNFQVEWRIRY